MDNKNYNKKVNENNEDINIKNTDNPLCKDGVCKIPENNFKKDNIANKNIMINFDN